MNYKDVLLTKVKDAWDYLKHGSNLYKRAYIALFFLIGFISFISSWIYCIATYGFFIGVTFGWIPSIIAGIAMAFLSPGVVLVIICILWKIS
jgi:hypothetical protein